MGCSASPGDRRGREHRVLRHILGTPSEVLRPDCVQVPSVPWPSMLLDTRDLNASLRWPMGAPRCFGSGRPWAAVNTIQYAWLSHFVFELVPERPGPGRSPRSAVSGWSANQEPQDTNKRGGRGPLKTPRTDTFVFGRTQPQARCCHYGTLKPTGPPSVLRGPTQIRGTRSHTWPTTHPQSHDRCCRGNRCVKAHWLLQPSSPDWRLFVPSSARIIKLSNGTQPGPCGDTRAPHPPPP